VGGGAAEILAEAGYSAPEVERMLSSICRTGQ
jgi:hypothetical protein